MFLPVTCITIQILHLDRPKLFPVTVPKNPGVSSLKSTNLPSFEVIKTPSFEVAKKVLYFSSLSRITSFTFRYSEMSIYAPSTPEISPLASPERNFACEEPDNPSIRCFLRFFNHHLCFSARDHAAVISTVDFRLIPPAHSIIIFANEIIGFGNPSILCEPAVATREFSDSSTIRRPSGKFPARSGGSGSTPLIPLLFAFTYITDRLPPQRFLSQDT